MPQRGTRGHTGRFPRHIGRYPKLAPDMYIIRDVRTCPDLHFYATSRIMYIFAYTCLGDHLTDSDEMVLFVGKLVTSAFTFRYPEKCPVYVPDARNVSRDQHRRYPVPTCPLPDVPRHHHHAHPRHGVRCPATHARWQPTPQPARETLAAPHQRFRRSGIYREKYAQVREVRLHRRRSGIYSKNTCRSGL